MSTHKKIDVVCVVAVIAALIITLLFMNGEKLGLSKIIDEDSENGKSETVFTKKDEDPDWSKDDATLITLNSDTAEISGEGAYVLNNNVIIAEAGKYVLTGNLEDGSIIVDATSGSKVYIALNNADIECSDNACFIVNEADKVFLTLEEGSENRLISGSDYSETAVSSGIDGAIYSRDDLTINGNGSLTIEGGYKHGIVANDDLVITGGNIEITATEDTIHINEQFKMENASITLNAGDDGITSENSVYIASGTLLINTCYEGIEAPVIDILGGDITIYPKDDGINANGGSSMFGGGPGGGFGGNSDFAGKGDFTFNGAPGENGGPNGAPDTTAKDATKSTDDESDDDDITPTVNISGGNITIINTSGMDADGIDSNGNIIISGGTIFIHLNGAGTNNALDYGSESGGELIVSGGTILASGGSQMLEGFSDSSTQVSFIKTFSSNSSKDCEVTIKDAEGNELITKQIPCSFTALTFSSSDLEIVETIVVSLDGEEYEISLDDITNQDIGGFGFNHQMPQREDAEQS